MGKFESSAVGRYFKMEARGVTIGTEVVAGVTTFLTLAYILAVNPAILADSGGTCHPCDANNLPAGCFPNQVTPFFLPAIFTDAYVACTQEVRRDLVIVTAGTSALATFLMGVGANLPFALAPGMGLNAYFTYTVVGFRGSGPVSYETALGAVFVEGLIFIAIAGLGLRGYVVHAIPQVRARASHAHRTPCAPPRPPPPPAPIRRLPRHRWARPARLHRANIVQCSL